MHITMDLIYLFIGMWLWISQLHLSECQTRTNPLSNGAVSSSNYPQMYDRQDHTHNILLTNGVYLILWLDDLDLPLPLIQPSGQPSARTIMTSCTDYIRIYEQDSQGTSIDIAVLCGNLDTYPSDSRYIVLRHLKQVYVTLHVDANSPSSFNGRGYSILYTTGYQFLYDPTYINRQDLGLISSPQFPDNPIRGGFWMRFDNIELSELFEFTLVYINNSQSSCSSIKKYMRFHNSFFICEGRVSDFTPIVHYSSVLIFGFYTDTNFLIKYRAIPNTHYSTDYTNTVDYTSDFTSLPEGSTCSWQIVSPINTTVRLYLDKFRLYKDSEDYCTYNSVYVTDGSGSVLFYHCPSTNRYDANVGYIRTAANVINVRVNNVSREVPVTFRLQVKVYSNQPITENTVIDVLCEIPGSPNVTDFTESPGISATDVTREPTTSLSLESSVNTDVTIEPTTTTTTTSPLTEPVKSATEPPLTVSVNSISLQLGILSGGTQLTIRGQGFPLSIMLLSYDTYSATSLTPCTDTTCIVLTPPGKAEHVGWKLDINVKFPGQDTIVTGFTFTYMPDPEVTSIHPLKTLTAGGTTLTVSGQGFGAVGDPELIVHMLHSLSGENGEMQNTTSFTSKCEVESNVELKCPSPEIKVPKMFQQIFDNDDPNSDTTNKDTTNDAIWTIDGESLEFTLGISLDGEQRYRDLTQSLPKYSTIIVFALGPEFNTFTETREVSSGDQLPITGRRLTDGLDSTDYRVRIGETGNCSVLDVTANELLCVVPEQDETEMSESQHSVLVHPGTNIEPHGLGEIRYKRKPGGPHRGISIGTSVAGGLLLLIGVILFIILIVRHARKKQPASSQQSRELQLSTVPHQQQHSSFDEPAGYLNDHMAPNVQTTEASIARAQRMPPQHDGELGYLNDLMAPNLPADGHVMIPTGNELPKRLPRQPFYS